MDSLEQWILDIGRHIGALEAENEALNETVEELEDEHTPPCIKEAIAAIDAASDEIERLQDEINDLNKDVENLEEIITARESDLDHMATSRDGYKMLYEEQLRKQEPSSGTFNQHQLFALLAAIDGTAHLTHQLGRTRYLLWNCKRNRFESTEIALRDYVHDNPAENGNVRLIMEISPQSAALETFRSLRSLLNLSPFIWKRDPTPPPELEPEAHDELVTAAENACGCTAPGVKKDDWYGRSGFDQLKTPPIGTFDPDNPND